MAVGALAPAGLLARRGAVAAHSVLEEQVVQLPLLLGRARQALGRASAPQVDVRAARRADRAARVLVEHELPEALARADADARVHEAHGAAREQFLVGGQAALAADLHVEAAARV